MAAAVNIGIDLLKIYPLNVALSVNASSKFCVSTFYFKIYFFKPNIPSHSFLISAKPLSLPSKFPVKIKLTISYIWMFYIVCYENANFAFKWPRASRA